MKLIRLFMPLLLGTLPLAGADFVSVNATGTASGNGGSFSTALSADGRFVAFESQATDLVPGGTSGVNIFVRDLLTGTTTLASVNDPPYTGIPELPHISADGRYVVYQRPTCPSSFDCNTVDVFLRDLQTATTTLISVGLDGQPASGRNPVISQDGRHVAFWSISGNITPNDHNNQLDIFVRDLDAGITRLASIATNGVASGNGDSSFPSLSADGRFVAFESDASNLVTGDDNRSPDVFVHDFQTGTTRLVSLDRTGTRSGDFGSETPMISADGSRVTFISFADDLAETDTNASPDVYVRDLPDGPTRMVSINVAGTNSGSTDSIRPYLTPNGRFVAFESFSTDLVAGVDTHSARNVYLRDVDAGTTRLVSVHSSDPPGDFDDSKLFVPFNFSAGFQVASDDGRYVVFTGAAKNLVSGVSYPCTAIPCYQIFRRDLQAGTTEILSASPAGDTAGNQADTDIFFSPGGQISHDGRVVVFHDISSNLSRQPDANNADDVFSVGTPQPIPIGSVPTLSEAGLALLALMMAALGLWSLRR